MNPDLYPTLSLTEIPQSTHLKLSVHIPKAINGEILGSNIDPPWEWEDPYGCGYIETVDGMMGIPITEEQQEILCALKGIAHECSYCMNYPTFMPEKPQGIFLEYEIIATKSFLQLIGGKGVYNLTV